MAGLAMDVVLASLRKAFSSPLAIVALIQSCVPPGFRFHPTEEELLNYYLRKKVGNEKIDLDVIRDVDLNKLEPWDIQESDQEEATMNRRKNKEKVKEEDRKGEAFRGEGGEFDREFIQKIRVRAADMVLALQRRAFRCAREVFDTTPKLENKQVQSKTGAVRRFWKKVDSNVTEMGQPDRSTAVRQKIKELRRLSSPTRPICFRCSDIGHIASQCCNAVLCFACNRLGHRSLQCQSITELSFKTSIDPTPKPQLDPQITPTPPTHPKTPIISAGFGKGQKSIPVYYEESVIDSIKRLEMELAEITQELALMKGRTSEMEIAIAGINAQEEKRWEDENELQKKPLVPKDTVNCPPSGSGSQSGTSISQPGNSINKGKDPMCSEILVPVATDPSCSKWLDTNVSDTDSVADMLQQIPSGSKKIYRTTSVCDFEKVLQAIEDERPLESQELTSPPHQMANKIVSKGRSIGGSLRPRRSIRLRVHGQFVSVKAGC